MKNEEQVKQAIEKQYEIIVDGKQLIFKKKVVTGTEILIAAHKEPPTCYTLYRKLENCDFQRISPDETIDISIKGIEEFVTKDAEVFNYTVDGEPETTDNKTLTAKQILELNAIDPKEHYLVKIINNGQQIDYAYQPDKPIKMVCTGMRFESKKWVGVVDIEVYGKECKPVPIAKVYKVRIDKTYLELTKPLTTGHDLLVAASRQPVEKYELFKVLRGQPQPQKIKDIQAEVNLREQCLIRFVTLPKEQQEGRGNRIAFTLPEEDIDFLDKIGLPWEAITESMNWLIIKDHPLPEGYQVNKADVALLIPPSYPAAEIDMAYFFPALQKLSGRPIGAITTQAIDGRVFQRWSRHRKQGEWRPGLDNVSTQMLLVNNWLENDLNK